MEKEIGNEKIFKFDTPDVFIVGEYVAKIKSEKYDDNYDYVFVDDNKDRYLVFGTYVINSKMRQAELGRRYKLSYVGEVTTETGRTYKDFKLFEVD